MTKLPALFISHGAPTVAIQNSAARMFLAGLGRELPRPTSIVVVSAHWEIEGEVRVTGAERPATIHDFGRFDDRLFEMHYPSPGDPALAERIAGLYRAAGRGAAVDPRRGLDHGAWIPLILGWPAADIPVLQVSLDAGLGPAEQIELGRVIAPLRNEGVLIIGSGSLTHNLHEVRFHDPEAATPEWVTEFGDWVGDALLAGRLDDLVAYRTRAPHAVKNHPRDEHFLPLFSALGAAGRPLAARRLHTSHSYGVLAMDAFAFG